MRDEEHRDVCAHLGPLLSHWLPLTDQLFQAAQRPFLSFHEMLDPQKKMIRKQFEALGFQESQKADHNF